MSAAAAAPVPEDDLTRLGWEILEAHVAAQGAFESAVRHAHHCGCLLLEAKGKLKHGDWLPWLREVGVPPRTAQVYMEVARKYADPAHLPFRIADALPKPKPTKDLRELCARLERAASGGYQLRPRYQIPLWWVEWPRRKIAGVALPGIGHLLALGDGITEHIAETEPITTRRYDPFPKDPRELRWQLRDCDARMRVLRERLDATRPRDYSGVRG